MGGEQTFQVERSRRSGQVSSDKDKQGGDLSGMLAMEEAMADIQDQELENPVQRFLGPGLGSIPGMKKRETFRVQGQTFPPYIPLEVKTEMGIDTARPLDAQMAAIYDRCQMMSFEYNETYKPALDVDVNEMYNCIKHPVNVTPSARAYIHFDPEKYKTLVQSKEKRGMARAELDLMSSAVGEMNALLIDISALGKEQEKLGLENRLEEAEDKKKGVSAEMAGALAKWKETSTIVKGAVKMVTNPYDPRGVLEFGGKMADIDAEPRIRNAYVQRMKDAEQNIRIIESALRGTKQEIVLEKIKAQQARLAAAASKIQAHHQRYETLTESAHNLLKNVTVGDVDPRGENEGADDGAMQFHCMVSYRERVAEHGGKVLGRVEKTLKYLRSLPEQQAEELSDYFSNLVFFASNKKTRDPKARAYDIKPREISSEQAKAAMEQFHKVLYPAQHEAVDFRYRKFYAEERLEQLATLLRTGQHLKPIDQAIYGLID